MFLLRQALHKLGLVLGLRNCTRSLGSSWPPLKNTCCDGANHTGPTMSVVVTEPAGKRVNVAGYPSAVRLVMYQNARPKNSRSSNVHDIINWYVTVGSGRRNQVRGAIVYLFHFVAVPDFVVHH
jgi:hypothetical protein